MVVNFVWNDLGNGMELYWFRFFWFGLIVVCINVFIVVLVVVFGYFE